METIFIESELKSFSFFVCSVGLCRFGVGGKMKKRKVVAKKMVENILQKLHKGVILNGLWVSLWYNEYV